MARVTDEQIDAIDGWFVHWDVALFRLLLEQTAARLGGDLAEMGSFHGKSAILIGSSLQDGETFTVVDLFGADPPDAANLSENQVFYPSLTKDAFEANYRAAHGDLPHVVQGPSRSVVDHAAHGTHRFVHVDAGHLYEQVVEDADASRALLKPGGVVVFDDIRTEHTPGVPAAVWRATQDGLRPFAVTPVKLYATWDDDPVGWADVVREWAVRDGWEHEVQEIAGYDVVRIAEVWPVTPPPRSWRDFVPPVAHGAVSATAGRVRRRLAARRAG